jgi:germination protein YpeB
MRSDKSKDSEDIAGAENFLHRLGIDNMKAVWTTKVHGVSVINFVTQIDGVIVYPDMIKVKVYRGDVVGFESFEYYLNHTDRKIEKPIVLESDAKMMLSSSLVVKNSRLAIVPKGDKEELCYEFMCESNGVTYYAYISAITKKQIELFEVQNGTEGVLLR